MGQSHKDRLTLWYRDKTITRETFALACLAGRVHTYPGLYSGNVHTMLGTKQFSEWPEGLILDWKNNDVLLWWSVKDQEWFMVTIND